MKQVFLDHSATTPVREQVMEAMLPYFSDAFGNASSIHSFGQRARKDLEDARKSVAGLLRADSREIIFTSGGTESDNLAIKGIAYASQGKGRHIVISSIEHPAVLNCCQYLTQEGYEVTYLPVNREGLVDPDSVKTALKKETVLVSILLANNEVGTLQPVKEIGEITRERGVPLHTDAIQAFGKVPVRVDELNVDLLSISGHKIYGPKGVGALYVRKETPMVPLMHGGHHEMGYRPGTENVAAIVGLAKAMELAEEEREEVFTGMSHLRSMLKRGINEKIENVQFNGHPEKTLPNILNASFKFIEGESLQLSLDMNGIAVSTGSACASGSEESSHVLMAMGTAPDVARGSLRFSLGRLNDEDDIAYVLDVLPDVVARLRKTSPLS
jgi:cysteine desulfurase